MDSKCSPKYLEFNSLLSFKKSFELLTKLLFLYKELWSYLPVLRLVWGIVFWKIVIFMSTRNNLQSRFIVGFKKFWGFFVVHTFSVFIIWSNLKNNREYRNWQKLTNESANWEQMTKSIGWIASVNSVKLHFLKTRSSICTRIKSSKILFHKQYENDENIIPGVENTEIQIIFRTNDF